MSGQLLDAARTTQHAGKLIRLSIGEEVPRELLEVLERVAAESYVDSVLALPDLHWKADMEVPSSLAITTRDVMVPEFTSMDVNDGMGVIPTGLTERDLDGKRLGALFSSINAHSAAGHFDRNRYSISAAELRATLAQGARALLGRYRLGEEVLAGFEDHGCVPAADLAAPSLLDVVPLQLLHTTFTRSEMGLNFGGNHFLEVQVVDEIADPAVASRWGFERGQVVVMYHLGPGPFSATLLNHYSRRTKLPPARVPLYFFSKLLFHYLQRLGKGSLARKWAMHFRQNGWTPVAARSDEGRLLRQAMSMAINFGYAYRLATVSAIANGLAEAFSPQLAWRLFCDVSHNGIEERPGPDGVRFVARHNACRLEPGQPSIVAGMHDVPSFLGVAEAGVSESLRSYDHGAGHLIESARKADKLSVAVGEITRYRMTRGRSGRIVSQNALPMRSAEKMERLMDCFQEQGMMHRVIRLKPVGNMKNG
ncbi:MAG: RtcB family protein [Candidatus Eiseniibacteriota bacterium]